MHRRLEYLLVFCTPYCQDIVWYDVQMDRVKIVTHCCFDEGMNDTFVETLPKNTLRSKSLVINPNYHLITNLLQLKSSDSPFLHLLQLPFKELFLCPASNISVDWLSVMWDLLPTKISCDTFLAWSCFRWSTMQQMPHVSVHSSTVQMVKNFQLRKILIVCFAFICDKTVTRINAHPMHLVHSILYPSCTVCIGCASIVTVVLSITTKAHTCFFFCYHTICTTTYKKFIKKQHEAQAFVPKSQILDHARQLKTAFQPSSGASKIDNDIY